MMSRTTRLDDASTEAAGRAVSAWLKQDLARRYTSVLREPLPAELLRLLDEATVEH